MIDTTSFFDVRENFMIETLYFVIKLKKHYASCVQI